MCGILKNWKRKGGITFLGVFSIIVYFLMKTKLISEDGVCGLDFWFLSIYLSCLSLSLGKNSSIKFHSGIISFKISTFIWTVLLVVLEAISFQTLVPLFLSLLNNISEMPSWYEPVKCLETSVTECHWLWSTRKRDRNFFLERERWWTIALTKLYTLDQIWKYILSQNSHWFKDCLDSVRHMRMRVVFSQW